jgi:hypothetical protein
MCWAGGGRQKGPVEGNNDKLGYTERYIILLVRGESTIESSI